jgi:hypothetical protein
MVDVVVKRTAAGESLVFENRDIKSLAQASAFA